MGDDGVFAVLAIVGVGLMSIPIVLFFDELEKRCVNTLCTTDADCNKGCACKLEEKVPGYPQNKTCQNK